MHNTIYMLALIAGIYIVESGYPLVGYFVILFATADMYNAEYGKHRKAWRREYPDADQLTFSGLVSMGIFKWLHVREHARWHWKEWCKEKDVEPTLPVLTILVGIGVALLLAVNAVPGLVEDLRALIEDSRRTSRSRSIMRSRSSAVSAVRSSRSR